MSFNQQAYANNADDRYFYIGGEFGVSEPVVKQFEHKESKTKIRLKRSKMIGAKIGYSFYPNMMIEISGTHQPEFRLTYTLPEVSLSNFGLPGLSIPETGGKTKVQGNVYTLNLIYQADPIEALGGLRPYAIIGGGVTKVVVKPASSTWKAPSSLPFGNVEYFKTRKTTTYCPTWQVGLGVGKDLASNFNVDVSAKLQVVQNIKIKYDTLSMATLKFTPATPIKQTIAVGEFALGFTYKLPF
jgi:hypothetical protein